jgi:hypothetical protein
MIERRGLEALIDVTRAHGRQLAAAGASGASAPLRQALAVRLVQSFRQGSGTAVAVFCHIYLMALDIERFRGGLVRREVMRTSVGREAA